jgi:hypothetical protein
MRYLKSKGDASSFKMSFPMQIKQTPREKWCRALAVSADVLADAPSLKNDGRSKVQKAKHVSIYPSYRTEIAQRGPRSFATLCKRIFHAKPLAPKGLAPLALPDS